MLPESSTKLPPPDPPRLTLRTRIDRLVYRYAIFTGRRPFATLGVMAVIFALTTWYGAGIKIRSNMEDLFPDSTVAVRAAKKARETLRSTSQMVIVFGSPDREANRRLATAFCDEAAKWPDVAAVECRRDIDFFRRNAALFISTQELGDIEQDVRKTIKKAAEKDLVDDSLTEGLNDAPAKAPTADEDKGKPSAAEANHLHLPTDAELQERFKSDDIREWNESPDGTVLGIKLFPTVSPQQVDQSALFVARVNAALANLKPTSFNPKMQIATSGDYSEMSEEIDNIRHGLFVTSALALLFIALLCVAFFRRWRTVALMFVPLLIGTALTGAFARVSIGYLNMITAFIFSMLFGMGSDYSVYSLARYFEERAKGHDPLHAVANAVTALWAALGLASAATAVAFFSLVVLEFRGFSQLGLIAGVGVLITLASTLAVYPPLIVAMHRLVPDPPPTARVAEGQRWLGWFVQPRIARLTLAGTVVLTIIGAFAARNIDFETNLRKLRTPPSAATQATAQDSARNLESAYHAQAEHSPSSPILVVTDSIDDALDVHRQLESRRKNLTRITHFVSIHSFVPEDQAPKIAIIDRIRNLIEAKHAILKGKDLKDADRALDLLKAKPYGPEGLPAFVRERFRDQKNGLGRFLLLYANGNLADARSVQQVIDQVGQFQVGKKLYHSTASFFILAEADQTVRKEGPIAVLLALAAITLTVLLYFRNITLTVYSIVPIIVAFVVFLGIAAGLGFELNLFSVTALPGILGVSIDGVTQAVYRWNEDGDKADLRMIMQQIGGATWISLLTEVAGYCALLFQGNPGLQSIAWWNGVGLLVTNMLSAILVGVVLVLIPPRRHVPA